VTEQPQPAPAAAEPAPPVEPASEFAPNAAAVGTDDRPEIAVGAAFAGGFLAALILKRLGR
jgi:hypothetical protein